MKHIALYWQILIAFIVAVIFGLLFKAQVQYVAWMGILFIKALKMIIIPLIMSSIISGIVNIGNAKNLGRLGLKTFGYYLITSTLALLTGLFFVNLIKPGVGTDIGLNEQVSGIASQEIPFSQTLMNIIPENIIQAMAENKMLSLIFFAVLFGFFITKTSKNSKQHLTDLFNAFFEVMMKITLFIIKFTPLGIFGIVTKQVAEQQNFSNLLSGMGLYMLVVILSLSVHAFITLPVLLKFVGKVNPFKHLKVMRTPLITAFSTSSSNATLPLTMDAVENKAGVSNSITSFTLPLGSTVNMDGTALYELVAAIFIAQVYGIDLTIGQQIIIVFTGLLASIGAAGIPMAGMVMISVILSAVGLPLEGIGLILSVDRILDMFRTSVNVWSDSCGAVIIAKSEGEQLKV